MKLMIFEVESSLPPFDPSTANKFSCLSGYFKLYFWVSLLYCFYLATNDERFDPVELALSAVGTLSLIPLAKPLKPLVAGIRSIIRVTPPKFVRAFGSSVGKLVERAWDSKSFDVVIGILPVVIIVGELAIDDEAREGLLFMLGTIESDADFFAWADYFTLPANGWEGDDGPPALELSGNLSSTDLSVTGQILELLVPSADAARTRRNARNRGAGRVTSVQVRRLLVSIRRFDGSSASRRKIVDGVRGVTQTVRRTNLPDLRRVAFNRNTLSATIVIGSTGARRLFRKLRNLRIPPYAVAGIIAYLESRRDCGDLVGCKPLAPEVAKSLENEFYRKVFTDALLLGNKDFVGGFENGALFHMAVTAYYHLLYEAGAESAQPIDVERTYNIPLFSNLTSDRPFQNKSFTRRIDLVLKGSGEGKETWVETKSYKRPFDQRRYTVWNFTKGRQSVEDLDDGESRAIHRQFFLDRVATQTSVERRKLGGDLVWWFHGFNRKTVGGYSQRDLTNARRALQELPNVQRRVVSSSLGNSRGLGSLNSKINIFGVRREILIRFRNELFDELSDVEFSNLIENSSHDQL